jgi:hypothetical protein
VIIHQYTEQGLLAAFSDVRNKKSIKVEDTCGDAELKWVLEVGFAETYEQLVEEMELWLEGTDSVSIAVLVKFIETPAYKCPIPLIRTQQS